MVSFEEARSLVLQKIQRRQLERTALLESLGRVLARNVSADHDQPGVSISLVEGFALRHADVSETTSENPVRLTLAGEVPPDGPPPSDPSGPSAFRVSNGSPLPPSMDTVLEVREGILDGDGVRIPGPVYRGSHVLEKGSYFRKGEETLVEGQIIYPEEINILSALGIGEVDVVRAPRVGVVTTGSELVEIGDSPAGGKLWGSNLYHLLARVRHVGGEAVSFGVVRDDKDEITQVLEQALSCDVVVTTGGTSAGENDRMKEALADIGVEIVFSETNFRPGKTFIFARKGDIPVFCLPGSPRSIVAIFHLFVRPTLLAMAGKPEDPEEEVAAILEEDLITKPGTMKFIFSRLSRTVTGFAVKPLRELARGGFMTSDTVNALTVVPEDVAYLKSGFEVSVLPLHEV